MLMNSLVKKLLIFLLVMAMVAGAGWYGRKAYKKATERRAIAEAANYLEKKRRAQRAPLRATGAPGSTR